MQTAARREKPPRSAHSFFLTSPAGRASRGVPNCSTHCPRRAPNAIAPCTAGKQSVVMDPLTFLARLAATAGGMSNRMRREVMARDGYACRCCGSATSLHVHHVEFRQRGGATRPGNLLTVCEGCHGRIHAGLLVVRGEAPDGIEMQARTGEPLQRVPVAGDPILRLLHVPDDGKPRGRCPPRTRPQSLNLDDIPAVVDRNWWRQHEHLLEWRSGGFRVKACARS
jgi:HNH endonuclease